MRPSTIALCLSLFATGGCAILRAPSPPLGTSVTIEPETPSDGAEWRTIARAADQQRIDAIDARWHAAIAALPHSLQPRTAADRQLLDPEAARPLVALPPGGYECRRIRLGGRAKLTRFKPDTCYVKLDGNKLSYTTQTGRLMPGGWLYPDSDTRQVLLATDRPTGVQVAPAYGVEATRDLIGVIERLGPLRWRLTIPRDDELDVWEITPWPKQKLED